MIQLYLIRHGEIAGDPHKRCTPPVSGCLSDRGVQQASALSETLQAVRFDAIFASPLGRAIQTAQALAGPRDLPIQVLDWLIEWRPAEVLDKVDGANYEQIALAAEQLRLEQSWKTLAGEGTLEITQRVVVGFLQLAKDLGIHAGHGGYIVDAPEDRRAFAFVAHGGSLGVLLGFLLGLPIRPHGYFSFEQTGVAVVNFKRRADVWYPTLNVLAPVWRSGGSMPA